jgi:hypothetical protein
MELMKEVSRLSYLFPYMQLMQGAEVNDCLPKRKKIIWDYRGCIICTLRLIQRGPKKYIYVVPPPFP